MVLGQPLFDPAQALEVPDVRLGHGARRAIDALEKRLRAQAEYFPELPENHGDNLVFARIGYLRVAGSAKERPDESPARRRPPSRRASRPKAVQQCSFWQVNHSGNWKALIHRREGSSRSCDAAGGAFQLEDGKRLKHLLTPSVAPSYEHLKGADLADVIREIHQLGR